MMTAMHTIVALGNPGDEYQATRHNAGRVVASRAAEILKLGGPFHSGKYGGEVYEGNVDGEEVRLIFPDTYMNHSGRAVKKLMETEDLGKLMVIYDEVDLPFGEFKLAYGRGAGGHNGIRSIIDDLRTPDFLRLRIGIAPRNWFGRIVRPRGDRLADYVLGKLTKKEEGKLAEIAGPVAEAIRTVLKDGRAKAMTRYN